MNLILVFYEFSINKLLVNGTGYIASTIASLLPSVLWHLWLSELIKFLNLDRRGNLYVSWFSLTETFLSNISISFLAFHDTITICIRCLMYVFVTSSSRKRASVEILFDKMLLEKDTHRTILFFGK